MKRLLITAAFIVSFITSPALLSSPIKNISAQPTSWVLSGALAVRDNKKASSMSIHWLQRGVNFYQIRLFGPLGSGTIILNKQGSVVTLRDGAKKASSQSAEALLARQTGLRLPVSNLYYWVRGLPAPGPVQTAERDAYGRLIVLKQAGFTLNYLGYRDFGKTALPNNIRLQGRALMIKLVVKQWKL